MKEFVNPEKGKIEYVIGIDFGHGETSAAICRLDSGRDPEDIDLTGSDNFTIPSAMFISNENGDEHTFVGYQAVAEYGKKTSGNFYAYFKSAPNSLDETKNPNLRIMKKFMWETYKLICVRYSSQLMVGNEIKDNHVVFIACPSRSMHWNDNAMQNYLQLAVDAGLPIAGASIEDKFQLSGIVRESRAAYIRALQKEEAIQKVTKGILVIDFGSSTVDITYYKEGHNPVDKGYETIGASTVESKIMDYLKTEHKGLDHQNPEFVTLISSSKEGDQYHSVFTDFLYKIRRAKEEFYKNGAFASEIELNYKFTPRYNQSKIGVEISKYILESDILKDYIPDIKSKFKDFKEQIIADSEVTLLVITGGASRMNFVQDCALDVFGKDISILPPQNSSLTVSNGIATAGRADVLLYFLANDLLTKSVSSIYDDVVNDAKLSIRDDIFSKIKYVYGQFQDGDLYENSVKALDSALRSKLSDMKSLFKRDIDTSFKKQMESCVNSEIKEPIVQYVSEHFPHFNIDAIPSYSAPADLFSSISSVGTGTLEDSIDDSLNKIKDGILLGSLKFAWNVYISVVLAIDAAVINIGKWAVNLFRDDDKQLEYISLDDVGTAIDESSWDFKGKDTILDYDDRKKICKTFREKESEYKQTLSTDISKNFPSFRTECDNLQKKIIVDYIISVINKIQLQIK